LVVAFQWVQADHYPSNFALTAPPNDELGSTSEKDAALSTFTKPHSQRNGSSQHNSSGDDNVRRSTEISPSYHNISLDNDRSTAEIRTSQHQRHPTESPAQFTNLNLPPTAPSSSNNDVSPSIEVPPSDENANNGNNIGNSSHLPPNAYSNTPTSLLNYDTSAPSSQLQPFNFFNDLNLGGNNNTGGGILNDFSGFGMTNSNSANLEYAVLSSMLQNSGFGNTSPMGFTDTLSGGGTTNNNNHSSSSNAIYQSIFTGSEDYGQMSYGFPPAAFENSNSNISNNGNNGDEHVGLNNLITISQPNPSPSGISSYLPSVGSNNDNGQNAMPSLQAPTNSFGALPIDHNWPTIASKLPTGTSEIHQQQQHQQQQQQQHQQQHIAHQPQNSPSYTQVVQPSIQPKPKPIVSSTGVMKVEDVYKHINKPYVSIRHLASTLRK